MNLPKSKALGFKKCWRLRASAINFQQRVGMKHCELKLMVDVGSMRCDQMEGEHPTSCKLAVHFGEVPRHKSGVEGN